MGKEDTIQSASVKNLNKNLQKFWYHGILSWQFAHHLVLFLKSYLYVRQRYGYPDKQILATLKQKLWIYRFLMMLMLDLWSILIFRVAIWFLTAIFCSIMAPLIWKLDIFYIVLILWIIGWYLIQNIQEIYCLICQCWTFWLHCDYAIRNIEFLRHIVIKWHLTMHYTCKIRKISNFQIRGAIIEQNIAVRNHMATLKIKINPISSMSIIKYL